MLRRMIFAIAFAAVGGLSASAWAGAIFLTGHDPDFHASLGGNTTGARNINTSAIDFITDSAFNPFSSIAGVKFLFVQSNISPPGGHTNGLNGIIDSGYTSGTDFEQHNASTLIAQPLMYEPASEQRKHAMLANSPAVPRRPMGSPRSLAIASR